MRPSPQEQLYIDMVAQSLDPNLVAERQRFGSLAGLVSQGPPRVNEQLLQTLGGQEIPEGLLDRPVVFDDASPNVPVPLTYCLSMIGNTLLEGTGSSLPTSRQMVPLQTRAAMRGIWRTLSTPAFAAASGKQVRTLTIAGCDLTDVANVAERLKSIKPEMQVFCVVDLDQPDARYRHLVRTILAHTAAENIITDEPNQGRTLGKGRQTNREDFIRRWAGGMFTANVITAY